MPAWYGRPPQFPDDGHPLPFVDPEPAGVWGDIWAEAFKVGDAVRVGGPEGCVGVVVAHEKQWDAVLVKKAWRTTVEFSNGERLDFPPHGVEKISLLDAVAEAARDD